MAYFDLHTHTGYSHDSVRQEDNMPKSKALRARELGFSGIAFTDHFDIYEADFKYPPSPDDSRYFDVDSRRADIMALREELGREDFYVCYGVELGGQFTAPPQVKTIIEAFGDLDMIIGSVHRTTAGFAFSNTKDNFANVSDAELKAHLDIYIKNLLWTAENGTFDTLAHCTYPFRYIVRAGRAHIAQVSDYYDEYRQLFGLLMERQKALEINTAGLLQAIKETSPGVDLIKIYRELGGELITVGSDSHTHQSVGAGVKETCKVLTELGFKHQCLFVKRQMKLLPL